MKAWIAAAIIACAGLWSIARQPGDEDARLSYDSVRYYAGALSLLESGRYLDLDGKPQHQWPAGMSLLYGALSRVTGLDPLALVPAVNVASYVATLLALLLLGRAAALPWWATTLLLAAFGWNSHYLSMHNKLWSEPPALALLALMLWCTVAALRDRPRTTRFLLAACAFASAAVLLRYAAVAMVPVVVIVTIMLRRWWLCLVALLTPLPAFLSIVGSSRVKHEAAAQSIPWEALRDALLAMANQILPAGLGIVVMLLWIFVRPRQGNEARTMALLWCFAYAAMLFAALVLADPPPVVDLRMLMPLYLGLLVLAAASHDQRRALAALTALPLAIAAARGARAMFTATPPAPQCVTRQWYVDAIRRGAPRGSVVSNAQGTAWLALRRPVFHRGAADTIVWIDPAVACENVIEGTMPRPAAPPAERGLIIVTPPRECCPPGAS